MQYRTENLRNVVLLSHTSAGKTTLCEAMLFNAGAIGRIGKVEEGNTTSDYEPEETKRQISINISLLPFEWKETKVNVIDTPGYADFVGEIKAGLQVAEGALIVVCAASGVEVGTELVWGYAEEKAMARFIIVNKMDRESADFDQVVEQLQAKFGKRCVPIQLPIGSQASFEGLVDLVALKAFRKGKEEEIPSSLESEVNRSREKLVEAVAETDDDLLTKYLDEGEISQEEIQRGLRLGVISGQIVPVLVGSATQSIGISQLIDALCQYSPSPEDAEPVVAKNPVTKQEETINPDGDTPLCALVFKTTADPYVGKLTYLRVYGGTLHSDSSVWNANKNRVERVGQLFQIRGKGQEAIPELIAGDIGAVAKLAETTTSDTLCSKEHPLLLPPLQFPPPVLSVAVHPKTKADLDKLGTSLVRMGEEDPTLQIRRDLDTGETILSGLGESHLEVVAEKMHRKFGIDIKVQSPRIPYKETITAPTKAEYKHKKQTGGHGQYGHVLLDLEPLSPGSGFQFAERVVGGSVPKNYISAVEKGLLEALHEGVVAGYPIVDLKVTLYDGSYHAVDSSDMAFKIASSHALRKGIAQGQPVLLEPIMNIRVTVPDSLTGDIMSDLNGKRAKVLGMNPEDGTSVIDAQAPLAEVLRYATDLRAMTQGRGVFTMEFSHYEEVPAHITQKIVAEARKEERD